MLKAARFIGSFVAGLRFRLLLLVVIACVPLVLLTLNTAWEDRRRARADWQKQADSLAQLVTGEEHQLVAATKVLLETLAGSEAIASFNPNACQSLVTMASETYPRYSNIGLLGTNGEALAAATPLPANYKPSQLPYFQRVLQTGKFSLCAIGPQPGMPGHTIQFGCPVRDRAGVIAGVLFATLKIDWERLDSLVPSRIPKAAIWTELSRDGEPLLRHVGEESNPRASAIPADLTKAFFARPSVFLESENPQGTPMVYGSSIVRSQLFGEDLAAVLTIPRATLFQEADQTLARSLGWVGVATCLALALGWVGSSLLVLDPVKALVKSSARLAAGDLSARTGVAPGRDELGQLTLAFDRMAHVIEERQHEQERATNKLQILSKRLVEVQETERRSIARELHDEIGQSLTAAEINLQAAMKHADSTAIAPRLRASSEMLQRVLEQVHDLSLELRPSMLDDLGLESALRWYANRQSDLTGVTAHFKADPLERRLDSVIETECFRIAQEALTNVARHSKADTVWVNLCLADGHLELTVRDNGHGFDVSTKRDQAIRGSSLGLLSMSERASLAGGSLEINSQPGGGTEVCAQFPLRWREADPSENL